MLRGPVVSTFRPSLQQKNTSPPPPTFRGNNDKLTTSECSVEFQIQGFPLTSEELRVLTSYGRKEMFGEI